MSDFLSPLYKLWLCESVRLREEQTGLLEDSEACRKARTAQCSLAERLMLRGLFLAKRDGLEIALQHWLQGAKLALWLLLLSALISGFALAKTALSGHPLAINIFWALAGLLGLNLLSLIAWCASLLLTQHSNSPLSQAWLWLSNKLARDAKAAQLAPALMILLQRHHLLRWGLGRFLHCWWLVTLTTALFTLIALLATRRYGFVWESTIVASDAFVMLVHNLGQPATWLGFSLPSSELIQQSGMQALTDEQARHIWASWLLGMLLIYGVLPRFLFALVCQWRWHHGVKRLQLDADDPIWQPFRERVQPSSERIGVVDAAPTSLPNSSAGQKLSGKAAVLVGIELDDSIEWPPTHSAQITYAGIIDTREQRRQILEQLSTQPPARLLVACNPQRSADRGTLNLIAELSRSAAQTRVWLLPTNANNERLESWQEQLDSLKLPYSRTAPWSWLETGDE
ncbi:DUF2868 domain-containing protein [Denitrificimonas sp. JX-1]|uniref:DUF2868 domain-containing protein n=1 Tax=Denitrificimonas halotolerans TaxID=3098930 RepID=A0ABU5GSN9_9GAMM|nr:DUF2868 domain-containing protein [Denitrificimonas sp. JX-1]MDY7220001.1 DUF2868 domain-containing protein [Denitrificimonas sp. JX-1]